MCKLSHINIVCIKKVQKNVLMCQSFLFRALISKLLLFRIKDVKWHIKDGTVHHILPIYNSGIEVMSYDSKTGEKLKSRRVSAPFISQETE